jgi:hypothetical protein
MKTIVDNVMIPRNHNLTCHFMQLVHVAVTSQDLST